MTSTTDPAPYVDTTVECSWCGQMITVVGSAAEAYTECGGEGEGSCTGVFDGDRTALRCHDAALTWAR